MAASLLISHFALLTGLSAKQLRHYDEQGLLCPEWIDEANGYRLYSAAQIGVAVNIRHWRQLGLPLKEIEQLLRHPDQTEAILTKHEARLREEITARQDALLNLQALAKENTMNYRLETLPTQQVLLIRETLRPPHYEVIPQALQELMVYSKSQHYEVSASSFFVHHAGAEGGESRVDICLPVSGEVRPSGRIQVQLFEGQLAFIGRFVGPYTKTGAAYAVVAEEALRRGLRLSGTTAEIYVKSLPHTPNPNAYETDIAFILES